MIFTCTIITLLLFRCFGFYDECITDAPKERIKNIKYNHPNNLILSHLNIISLRNKFQCLEYIMGDNIDILLLSETKLCGSFPNSQFLMDGFQVPYRADRDDKGGGLLFYVKDNIPCRQIHLVFVPKIEAIVLEINLKKRKWLLFGIYNPHKVMTDAFLGSLCVALDELSLKYENIVILGDFNCEMTEPVMKTFNDSYNLKSLVKEATCFKNVNKPSCIDLILTNKPLCFQHINIIETGLSDFHKLTLTILRSKFQMQPPKILHYRCYRGFNKALFQNDLMHAVSIIGLTSISCKQFEDIFIGTLNKHAPPKKEIYSCK